MASNVGEALYAVLAARARRAVAPGTGARPPSWREALERLVDEHGSAAGVARELGLPRTTVQHWRAGRTPKDPSRLILAALKARR